ncbi:adenylate kinase [bacterium]|nr:adenylate kinase [bacterium]
MRLLILGPPGVGKGTQAVKISKVFKIPHISTGDILREAVKNKTEVGIKANEYMGKGELVPDSVVIELIKDRIKNKDCQNGYLLDGFPRTLGQAKALDTVLSELNTRLDKVIQLYADEDEIVIRLTGRRLCNNCGRNYHVKYLAPKKESVCDDCGATLSQREDDTEKIVRNRLQVYDKKTKDLIDYYKEKNILVSVDAGRQIDTIANEILKKLNNISLCSGQS